jgi:hypothetical protein
LPRTSYLIYLNRPQKDLMAATSYHGQYQVANRRIMIERKKYVFWKDDDMWLGYLDEYPDYMTQGKTLEELKENLIDIFNELNSGNIPSVRKVAELEVA